MRFAILALFIGLVAAQGGLNNFRNWFNQNNQAYTLDVVHDFRFVDHDIPRGEHLLVAVSNAPNGDGECFLIVVDSAWEGELEDPDTLHLITEEIYHLIETTTTPASELTTAQLHDKYGDNVYLRECFQHHVYELSYKPSV